MCFLCYQTYGALHQMAMRGNIDARKWTNAAQEKLKKYQSPSFTDLLEYAADHWSSEKE